MVSQDHKKLSGQNRKISTQQRLMCIAPSPLNRNNQNALNTSKAMGPTCAHATTNNTLSQLRYITPKHGPFIACMHACRDVQTCLNKTFTLNAAWLMNLDTTSHNTTSASDSALCFRHKLQAEESNIGTMAALRFASLQVKYRYLDNKQVYLAAPTIMYK